MNRMMTQAAFSGANGVARNLCLVAALCVSAGTAMVVSTPALAQGSAQTASAATPLPSDPRLVQGELENGLKYIVLKHSNPPGKASVYLHISTGSLNESDRQRGIAHFLEHMAFNGSENFPAGTVVPFFQSLGLQFGRHQNAFTSFEQTSYILSLPDAKPETLDKGMMFFADVATKLNLDPAEIEAERQVIMEELRTGLGPQQRVQDYLFKHLAPGSLFGERLPIGVEETILGVTQDDFLAYYKKNYVPSNMTLLVVADAEPSEVIATITKNFSGGAKVPRPTDQDIGLKPQTEKRAIVATDPELRGADVSIVRVVPPMPAVTTQERFREDLVETIGTWIFNRRIESKIKAGEASFDDGGGFVGDLFQAMRIAQVSASGQPEKWEAMLSDLATELQRARLHGFLGSELEDARKALIAQAEQAEATESTRPAEVVIRQMNSRVAAGEPIMSAAQELDLLRKHLPGIQLSEVSERFAANFAPDSATFVVELPSGGSYPAAPSEADVVARGLAAVSVTPEPLKDSDRPTELLAKAPTPGEIAEQSVHEGSQVTNAWLSNGVLVHHKFMDIQKDRVAVTISLAGGEVMENAQNHGVSEAAGLAWTEPATRTLSSTNVRDLMTGKKVSVSGGASADTFTLTVSGSPGELEPGMQLAYLMLTEPKVEQAAFDRWKVQSKQELEQMRTTPQGRLAELLPDTILPKGEVRNRPMTAESLDRLSLGDAQAWLDKTIASAPIEVSVVGDVSKERALELARTYLGSLSNRPRIAKDTLAEFRTIVRPKGPLSNAQEMETMTPVGIVVAGFFGPDAVNVRDSRLLQMSSRVLSTRMIKKLREEEQLVYSIGVQSQPGTVFPGYGLVFAAAPTDPSKTDKLGERVHEMFAEFAASGPTEEELTVARKQFANQIDEAMKQPGFWSQQLANLTYRGRTLDDVMNANEAFQSFSASDLREGFSRYYTPENRMVVSVKPIAPAGATDGAAPKP